MRLQVLVALLALGWSAVAWSREVCTQPGSAVKPCAWFELKEDYGPPSIMKERIPIYNHGEYVGSQLVTVSTPTPDAGVPAQQLPPAEVDITPTTPPEWVCQYGQCRRPFDPGQICLNFGDAEHISCVDAPWHFSGTPILATVTSTTDTLLSMLRAEIAAAVADDDAGTIATLEAAVQAIKRRHPARQP